jgi:hypothetical protein
MTSTDDEWGRRMPTMLQALADADGHYFWPQPAVDVLNEVGRWAAACSLPRRELGEELGEQTTTGGRREPI